MGTIWSTEAWMATSLTNLKHYRTEGKVFIIYHHQQWDECATLPSGDVGGVHGMEKEHIICKKFDNCEQGKVMGAIYGIFTGLFLLISRPFGGTGTTVAPGVDVRKS